MRKQLIYLLIILSLALLIFILIFPKLNNKDTEENKYKHLENIYNPDEISYIIDNQIDLENLNAYSKYKYFNIYNYFDYENIRESYNYSHLEAINYYRYPNYYSPYTNPKIALFIDSPLVLVNKSFYLPKEFIPTNLDSVLNYEIEFMNSDIMLKRELLLHYELMWKDAKAEDIEFTIFSGFRSYKRQEFLFYEIYNDDTISAKPGHSEHQSGYAIDISIPNVGLITEFEKTNTYNWLINNCHNYGFILRFPKDKTNITTYVFEPWHFRYVGVNAATFIMENSLTLEEYLFSYLEI